MIFIISLSVFLRGMDNVSIKRYAINQKTIKVHFRIKVVSIDCTAYTSKKDLSEIYQACKNLIHEIKNDYKTIFERDLKISNRSFIAEICGHLVAYKVSVWIKKHFKFSLVQKLAKFAAHRSGVIDCGEAKVDTNRWLWDFIGWMFFRGV
ncbi:MAG: hypothetical protein EOO07_06175 [Chitinophagaceae bacterium]|nr:MAG: hypothetical protein EOO07_06175 [Chitinophagaceae bacterium]